MRVFVCSDAHVPFHNDDAVSACAELVKDTRPDLIVFLGDMVDFYQLSRFDKSPTRLGLLQEDIDNCVDVISRIRGGRKRPAVYVEGNHELRLRRWVHKHPEIASLRSLDLEELLQLQRNDIKLVRWENILRIDNVVFTHGEFVRKWGGMTAVAQMLRYQCSGVSGHSHRLGVVYWRGMGLNVWGESGCLCDRNPDWTPLPDWHNGALLVDTSDPYRNISTFLLESDSSPREEVFVGV